MNQTLEVIDKRKSLRAYADRPLSQEEKDIILNAAFRAPTAGNLMLYAILEIEDQALKDRLVETCDNQPFIATAPYILVFLADYQRWLDVYRYAGVAERCQDLGRTPRQPGEGDLLLACCDALIAAQNAVIAAESIGIGSCYIGDILENYEIHRQVFSLPQYAVPVAMLCFGHPAQEDDAAPPHTRFFQDYIVHKNAYRRLSEDQLDAMMAPLDERFANSSNAGGEAQNSAQFTYFRKFIAEFSIEMNRSVREMIKSWIG